LSASIANAVPRKKSRKVPVKEERFPWLMPVFLMQRHIVDFDYLKPAGIRLLSDTGFG